MTGASVNPDKVDWWQFVQLTAEVFPVPKLPFDCMYLIGWILSLLLELI